MYVKVTWQLNSLMIKGLKDFGKFAALPIMLFILMGVFLLLYNLFNLPSFEEILDFAQNQFQKHGYLVVLIASLIEGFLLVNWLFPGSIVMVMGAVFATKGQQSIVITMFLITFGLYAMSIFNYYLGKYGWYKVLVKFGLATEIKKMKARLEKHGLKILVVTYFHPQVGALTATAAGILQIKSRKFLVASLLTYVLWSLIWTASVYIVGEQMLKILNFKNLMIIVGGWIIFMIGQFLWNGRNLLKNG